MSTPVWPDHWPKPYREGFESNSVSPWVEDRAEVGAPRRRKRFTRSLEKFSFQMRVSTAIWQEMKNFYNNTLDGGVLSFEWTDPTTTSVYTVQAATFKRKSLLADLHEVSVELHEI